MSQNCLGKHFFLPFLFLLVLLGANCRDANLPPDAAIASALESEGKSISYRILGSKTINLDESIDLESLLLVQSAQSESLLAFSKSSGDWKLLWKATFHMLTLGPYFYETQSSQWKPGNAPGQSKSNWEGDCIKRIVLAELPGDSFNSVFLEVLSEEPPLGLFSIPFAYRKGQKILDGLATLKDHENTIKRKKVSFEYNPKEKSVQIFPNQPNYSLEFIFNGWEMVPRLPAQPIPALLESKVDPPLAVGKESKITLTLKNRGGSSGLVYLSFSFPEAESVRIDSTNNLLKYYPAGSQVYHNVEKKKIPSLVPLIELTKESWGENYKSSVSFFVTPKVDKDFPILFRSSYKAYREEFHSPDSYSISKTKIDQQGFYSYPILLP